MSSMFGMPQSQPKPRRPAPSKGITPAVGQAVLVSHNKITDNESYCTTVWEVVAVSPQACVVKPAEASVFKNIRPGPYMLWFRDYEFYDATVIMDGLMREDREAGLMPKPSPPVLQKADLRFGPDENFAKSLFNHMNGDDD